MPVLRKILPQDAAIGCTGSTINGIAELARFTAVAHWDAAVAYATRAGCERLHGKLTETTSTWAAAQKRWLVSMDFGRTEPEALRFLAALQRSEVRVPDGCHVANATGFAPSSVFHPKVFMCRGPANPAFGLVVGSGNLTISGLAVGTECGTLGAWRGRLDVEEREALAQAQETSAWFDVMWDAADPLEDVIGQYETAWRRRPVRLPEDETLPAQRYRDAEQEVVARDLAANYAAAQALWIEVRGRLYANLTTREVGNQVDLKRGARVFFGFPAADVPTDTVLGQVRIGCPGYAEQECSVRYGNNQMDKVNLPIPGRDGPDSYDNSILIFERIPRGRRGGVPRFRLTVTDETGLAERRAEARAAIDVPLRSGRGMGLLF